MFTLNNFTHTTPHHTPPHPIINEKLFENGPISLPMLAVLIICLNYGICLLYEILTVFPAGIWSGGRSCNCGQHALQYGTLKYRSLEGCQKAEGPKRGYLQTTGAAEVHLRSIAFCCYPTLFLNSRIRSGSSE
jgi:hypothetical protein